MALKVQAIRNDESGHVELGVQDGDHFVALATMPTTQYDATIENLKAAAPDTGAQSS